MDDFSRKELSLLSDIVYAAHNDITSPESWQEILEKTSRLITADSLAVAFYSDASRKPFGSVLLHHSPEFDLQYKSYFYRVDPMPDAAHKSSRIVCRPEDVLSVEEWVESEFYNDFYHPFGYQHLLCGAVLSNNLQAPMFHPVTFHFLRSGKGLGFSDRELQVAELLSRHFSDAYNRNSNYQEIAQISEMLEAGLDISSCGILVFNENVQLIHANKLAKILCDEPCFQREAVMQLAKRVLADLIFSRTARAENKSTLEGSTENYRLSASVAHVDAGTYYIVKVCGAQGTCMSGMRETAKSFGLSHREAEVCAMVVRGYSNKDIADKLFISELTVKDHLKHIFNKLRITKRVEIASKIITV